MNTLTEATPTAPSARLRVVRLAGPDGRWSGFDIEVVPDTPPSDSVAP